MLSYASQHSLILNNAEQYSTAVLSNLQLNQSAKIAKLIADKKSSTTIRKVKLTKLTIFSKIHYKNGKRSVPAPGIEPGPAG